MLAIERCFYGFRRKDIWFSDLPYDVEGCHAVCFYSCRDKADMRGFVRRDFVTPVIDLATGLDTIWKNIDRWSCRKKINKAYNKGIEIEMNCHYDDFQAIDRDFRKSRGLPGSRISEEYMRKYGTLAVARLDGRTVAGQLFLEDADHIRGLIAGSRRFGPDGHENNVIGYANRLIVWESIKYAREKGIKEYDMGGYYVGSDKIGELKGINAYKMSFGPRLVTKYNYEKSYSPIFSLTRRAYDYGLARVYSRLAEH